MIASCRRHLLLLLISLICALFHFFCSNSSTTEPNTNESGEDIVKTITFEPGEENSIEFPGNLAIQFSAGAFDAETEVKATELDMSNNPSLYCNIDPCSTVYILTPHGQVLNEPARVKFDISEIEVPDGYSTADLEIYTYNDDGIEAQNAWTEDDKLVCAINHFSMLYVAKKMKSFSSSKILDTPLYIYKYQDHLCFDNIFGSIIMHPT